MLSQQYDLIGNERKSFLHTQGKKDKNNVFWIYDDLGEKQGKMTEMTKNNINHTCSLKSKKTVLKPVQNK